MKKIEPPYWADAFLEWYCSKEFIDEVQGDLHEWFHLRVKRQGLFKARLFYFIDVIRFLRSYRIKSIEEFSQNSNQIIMLKNYLTAAIRSFQKHKSFAFINLIGLSVGITAFLLIWLYVQHETSYDQFHKKKENLYRVQLNRFNQGELTTQWAAGCAGVGPSMKENFEEVETFVKMKAVGEIVVARNEKFFKEEKAFYTTKDFFNVFTVNLIQGESSAVLERPYTMVLSESTARKYFGNEDPVGQTLKVNNRVDFEITGVYSDIPENSHMEGDILVSFETFVDLTSEQARTAWQWDGFYTYILLRPGTDVNQLESKFPEFIQAEESEELERFNQGMEFNLQPITDIHLTSDYMMEFKSNGDEKSTNFLFIVSIFIILIAWVNYINLSTAKSMDRSREVGIRKVMGSLRRQLIKQFLVESFILNLLALILAFIALYLLLPLFSQLSGRPLLFNLYDPGLWIILVSILVLGTLCSGLYPAFVLSGFKPVTILKGKYQNNSKGINLRQGLVVFQFLSSLVLMIGTLTVYYQLNYMRNQELGVDIDRTLVLNGPQVADSTYVNKLSSFKDELSSYSQIEYVTASTSVPGNRPGWNAGGIRLLEQDETESNQYRIIGSDADFMEAYDLTLLAGRKFDENRPNENERVLMNESAAKLIGFQDFEKVLNKKINFWGDTFEIVGVIKDFHQESLKKSFEPLIFRYIPTTSNFYSIKTKSADIQNTIAIVEEKWNTHFPGNPFDFFFLDDHYDKQYRAEIQFGKVFGLFAALAIFIACLGLFGLASFMTTQRRKEIGVRKVLGATLVNVVTLLSKNFLALLLFASAIGIPFAWWIMNNWLQDFAYRISLQWWVFVVPVVMLLLIAMITISWQTIKAAMGNPVDSLRNE